MSMMNALKVVSAGTTEHQDLLPKDLGAREAAQAASKCNEGGRQSAASFDVREFGNAMPSGSIRVEKGCLCPRSQAANGIV